MQNVERALMSVERRFAQHQARINRVLAMGGGSMRPRAAGGSTAGISREIAASTRAQKQSIKLTEDQRKAVRLVGQEAKLAQREDIARHKERLRAVEREKRAEIAKIRAGRLERDRERKQSRREFTRSLGTGVSGGVRSLAAVGTAGAAMIGVGGSALAASAVAETLRLDEQIRRFAIAGRSPGTSGLNPEAVRRQVMGIAMSRGVAPEAVLGGAQQFQTITGKGEMGLKMADTFATFAQATGGDPREIAAAAASLFQNLKIEDIDALTESLAKLTFQGKAGSFEFKDMADQLPRITAALGGRGIGGGTGGVSKMGAALQVIQRGTGDAAVTSTAFDAVLRQLIAKAGDIQDGSAFTSGKRVNVFEGGDATGAMRGDFDTLIADVLKASGGNAITLQKMFGDEGMKGLNPFVAAFKDAGGGDAGHAAVLKLFKDFEEVGGSYIEIQRDAADVQKSTSIQFEIAVMELKDVFSQELVPTIRELAPRVRDLGPAFRMATQGALAIGNALADNPVLGIGSILSLGIAAEITKAQLASVLQGGIVTPLGAVGMAAGIAAAGLLSFMAYLEAKENEGKKKASDAAGRANEIRNKAQAEFESTGALTPETRAQLEQLRATEQKTLGAGNAIIDKGTTFGQYANTWMAALGNDKATAQLEREQALVGAATSRDYVMGAEQTKYLLENDKRSQQIGPEAFKAEMIGAAIGDAAVKKINESKLNTGNSPSVPAVK